MNINISKVMNINLIYLAITSLYLGTSDVIKLVEYEYTLKYCNVLWYQCKLHYTVYSIHGRSEPVAKP